MFLNYIVLCVSASIDAIGIGISYGVRKSIINNYSKIIIAFILYISTFLGVTVGNVLSIFLTEDLLRALGSLILIIIGIFIIKENILLNKNYKKIRVIKQNKIKDYSKINSKVINWKEAVYLAISVSIDAFSMGVYASIDNVNIFLFPLCMTIIHLSFLFLGKFLGEHIADASKISENILKIFSGILLIFIGCIKYVL